MSLFLVAFFLIYGGMHFYVFLKAWNAFHFKLPLGAVIGALFLVMVLAPVFVRLLERQGHDSFAEATAYGGYTWAGIIFLFFTISLSIDVVRLATFVVGTLTKTNLSSFITAYRLFFLVAAFGSVAIGFYGFMEAKDIRSETLRIYSQKIPKEIGKITIVQISDVHLGLLVRGEKLARITELIRKADPDLLVSTGDFVDGDMDRLNGLAGMLKEIAPRFGKFAVTGNHEYYAGIDNALAFTRNAGFTVLGGEGVTVGGILNVVGVDDVAGAYFKHQAVPERGLLSALPRGLFTVLLKHRPVVDKGAVTENLFDLQLSGHTHKGQIFPFRYLVRLTTPFYGGYHRLASGVHLYVSRGTGTWGPPIRFFAPPEVTVIEVVYSPHE